MKKIIAAFVLAVGLLSVGACSTVQTDTSPPRINVQEVESTIAKARLAVAAAQAALVVIPTCVVDKPQVCMTEATKTKFAGYAAMAQSSLATVSALLATNLNDPVSITEAVRRALKAVNDFIDAVNVSTA